MTVPGRPQGSDLGARDVSADPGRADDAADARAQRVVEFYEGLRESDLARLGTLYLPDARFKDPFNDVRGVEAIGSIFAHMFGTLRAPRFVVHEVIVQGDQGFLTWDFHFAPRRGGTGMTIRGATHLRFAADGRVAEHRDYWDVAEELYEKLPLIGTLMRWLKRRAGGGPRQPPAARA